MPGKNEWQIRNFHWVGKDDIFLVVFTDHEFEAPGKNLYIHREEGGIAPGGTQDWGYVFDRNYDGKVDYLAFLDGPNPVVPDNWEGDLPNLTKPFTVKVLEEVVLPSMELLFWHAADDNYDGFHDGIAVSMRNLENGWIDGWMVARDTNFDGRYDFCRRFRGRLHSDLGDCHGSPEDYRVPKKEPSGISRVPLRWDVLAEINAAAEKCQLSGESFLRLRSYR